MEKPYTVRFDARVAKFFRKLPKKHARQVKAAIERLSVNPRPQDSSKLELSDGYRVTVGEYRILYTIDYDAKLVTVYRIGPKNDSKVYNE